MENVMIFAIVVYCVRFRCC